MVEFLVERGADVNRGDNEGWTPLHATASCGFLSIAKYVYFFLTARMMVRVLVNELWRIYENIPFNQKSFILVYK